ncbi:MAG TPA: MFS transporter [Anaerolineaceae bacterium]|nr:MFS transporter [Anaerolineaceae bacterium]HQP62102.1 MFS transporter [Anaerolineaceae bacterium]
MTPSLKRTRTTWLTYGLLALYGYFLNILGPITPYLHDEFQLSYTVSSLHFSAFAVGILLVGLGGHLVIHRIGRWLSLAVGAMGLGAGALLLVLGRHPVLTVGGTFLMGCVGSLILAVVPAALSEEHGELRAVAISEANVLASLASATAPLLVGWLAGLVIGWRLALILAAAFALLLGFLLLQPGRVERGDPSARQASHRLPLRFWFHWFTLVLAVAVEFCMVFWCADFLETELHLPRAGAAQAVSLFLAGMIVGRLAGSRVLHALPPRRVILLSNLLAIGGFLLFWTAQRPAAGLIGLALTGLGVASLYPMILATAIGAARVDESRAGARTTLASGTAILLLPLVLGRFADTAGLRAAYGVVAALLLLLLGLVLLSGRFSKTGTSS